jgi:signal peptidase
MSIVRLKNRYGLAGRIRKAAGVVLKGAAIALPVILMLIIVSGFFGVRYLCVVSPSMEPELPVGSLIVVVPRDNAKIKEGDNLTYRAGNKYITHKVIKNDAENRTFTTKGTAGKLEDPPVKYECAEGVEVLCLPGLGRVLTVLRTTVGRIVLMTAAAGIFMAVILTDIVREKRRRIAAIQNDLSV